MIFRCLEILHQEAANFVADTNYADETSTLANGGGGDGGDGGGDIHPEVATFRLRNDPIFCRKNEDPARPELRRLQSLARSHPTLRPRSKLGL